MEEKEKVIALYNYIAEVSKSLKDTKTNVTEEKWFNFFENFPRHENIIFDYKNLFDEYFEKEESKLLEIKRIYEQKGYILDPHSAVGHLALQYFLREGQYGTFLSTAHPHKFDEVIRKVIPAFKAPEVDTSACDKRIIGNHYEEYLEILTSAKYA